MRLRIGRRQQSSVRRHNGDDIATEPNICYDSVFSEPDHDQEFREYDDIVHCRESGPSGEGIPLYENTRPLYENINQLGEMQISSEQSADVPHEYEIPVQINSAYQLRDTPNDYEN